MLKRYLIIFILIAVCTSYPQNTGDINNIDSLYNQGVLTFKAGVFPYSNALHTGGMSFLASTNGSFKSYLDFGFSAAYYYGFVQESGHRSQYVFGGINFAHKFAVQSNIFLLRLHTGFSIVSYPTPTFLLEFDYPVLSMGYSTLNLSVIGGTFRFDEFTPVCLMIGYYF